MLDWTPNLVKRISRTIANAECIDREIMPQVDEHDIDELIAFLASRGYETVVRVVNPHDLRGYQRINKAKVHGMAKAVRDKGLLLRPSLISGDEIIVDGNHRSAVHRILSRPQGVLQIEGRFEDIFGHVCEFPKTYEV